MISNGSLAIKNNQSISTRNPIFKRIIISRYHIAKQVDLAAKQDKQSRGNQATRKKAATTDKSAMAALILSYQTAILCWLFNYSMILITTPEPTVRPPSRIAKRRPSSIAMGAISSTVISMLSPGMHISTPSGRVITPVTSVVLK